MKFQTKLLLAYLTIMIFIVVFISGSLYYYDTKAFEENAKANLKFLSVKMIQQMDYLIQSIDYTMESLISNNDFMSSMAVNAYLDKRKEDNALLLSNANRILVNIMYRDPLNKNFHRVTAFNRQGDFYTSRFENTDTITIDVKRLIKSIDWLEKADCAKGTRVLVPPYMDPWVKKEPTRVFGVVRSISWSNGPVGYIEIQVDYDTLKSFFKTDESKGISVIVTTENNEIIYKNLKNNLAIDYYLSHASSSTENIIDAKNPYTGENEIITTIHSDYSGLNMIVLQNKNILLQSFANTTRRVIMLSIGTLIIAFVYVYLWSIRLTRPIRELKEEMEGIDIDNLEDIKFVEMDEKKYRQKAKDELFALDYAFKKLRTRLYRSIKNEMKAREVQMKAEFDSLQTQINPHFIYNILNVISSKGMEAGDEEIGEICNSIAEMLRYSTSTEIKSATLGMEINHAKNYLSLLKKRYEHRLDYIIEVESIMLDMKVPKIILQPFVENSIKHGYKNGKKNMHVAIKGWIKNCKWYIRIEDNGEGFEQEQLEHLREKIRDINLEQVGREINFRLGGMGIINTYIRLLLYFKGKIQLQIGNCEASGAFVILSGDYEKTKVNNDV